jgi:hypothetical protein
LEEGDGDADVRADRQLVIAPRACANGQNNPTAKGQTIESLRLLKPAVLGELEKTASSTDRLHRNSK